MLILSESMSQSLCCRLVHLQKHRDRDMDSGNIYEHTRVTHQRSDTMYSRTVFPGVRTNVVRLLHTENIALLVLRLYTKSEELARLYQWFMPSKRSLSDVT